jgi:hypothetical protein
VLHVGRHDRVRPARRERSEEVPGDRHAIAQEPERVPPAPAGLSNTKDVTYVLDRFCVEREGALEQAREFDRPCRSVAPGRCSLLFVGDPPPRIARRANGSCIRITLGAVQADWVVGSSFTGAPEGMAAAGRVSEAISSGAAIAGGFVLLAPQAVATIVAMHAIAMSSATGRRGVTLL